MMTHQRLPLKIEGFEDYRDKLMRSSPTWLREVRQGALERLGSLGLPSVKEEDWKYTSLEELSGRTFRLPSQHKLVEESQFKAYVDSADINIVLVNGVLWGELSSLQQLPVGLSVKTLSDAAFHASHDLSDIVTKLTASDTKPLLYLNQGLFLDGVDVKIEDNAVIAPLVHIVHITSGVEDDTVVFPRSIIHVGKGAEVTILESHIGFTPNLYWSNALTDIRIGEGAHVEYCKAEGESSHTIHLGATRIWQERDSHLESFSFAHRAKLVRNNLAILLKGEGTHTVMNGFYAIDGHQHVDNHTLLDIQQPNCTGHQLYKGILKDSSHAVFNGKIFVHPIAQQTNAYQLNKHLMLGKEARVDTKPQLEIFADDVKCTHGATIGQLNDDEIFYLQSRCISRELAAQLLAKGFIDDIVMTIGSESTRRKLGKLLAKKFPDVKL